MPKKQKLTIDREVWLRGDGDNSMLLDGEGKRCCVGIYLQSCGVPDKLMHHTPDVESLVDLHGVMSLPKRARWMYDDEGNDIPKVEDLYADNDSADIEDGERELIIAEKFAAYGVEVTFVN